MSGTNFSRRQVLRTGGGAAALAALGVLGAGTGSAWATVGSSPRFDLTAGSTELIREKTLQNATVMQSFAFDNVNRYIYTAQLMEGGITLVGETAPVSGADRAKRGDLCITRLDLAGNRLGRMYLLGFGHGVQIGAEPVGGSTYLWTETDAVSDGTNAWGRSLARFPFREGQILKHTAADLEKHAPVPAATSTTANIDPAYNRLVVRYRLDGAVKIGLYDLSEAKAGRYNALATVTQPAVVAAKYPFQGYAAHGRYLYLLEGSAYGTTDSVEPTGNTYITCVDFTTGAVVSRELTKAGYTLSYREPEGMAIQLPDPTNPGAARLCLGLASGATGARKASIYYKDKLVSG